MDHKTPDTLSSSQLRKIDELFDKTSKTIESQDNCWRIKWRGRFIKVNSGKTMWASENNAKMAFRCFLMGSCHHLYYEWEKIIQNDPNLSFTPWASNKERFFDYIMKSKEVEFVNISLI